MPTLVIKLDFTKALDSVNWLSLLKILEARGFPEKWSRWMELLLKTSLSAVLVNGVPGPWIDCKRGLRHGDSLSPYLFLLVADVLQMLIKKEAGIHHPMADGPCPVLQYADDTIILVRAELGDARKLKDALDMFSNATGLTINFHKSTVTRMNLPQGALQSFMDILQCKEGSFPRRSDSVSGAQCLVAWDNVCRAKEDGGLGIKQLDTQNACLLMKLLHRLHHPADSAWAHWIGAHVHLPDLGGDMARAHWTALRDLLPAYQCITIVSVGDSRDTSFWDDTWLLDVPLADKMPALHSHFTARATSVRDVLGAGLRNLLQHRLTAQATEELEHLEVLLQDIDLIQSPDQRSSFFEDGDSHRLCKAP
ncbi:uncharacterized protein [Miscanthus floridulus]|uniref:uncharacterized protein n=1 Tax=Miscanthus floridulus TaxID=154761 RepID=UPI0034583307